MSIVETSKPKYRAAEADATLARISARYDQTPYISRAYDGSHPARIAAVARIFGLDAPDLENARVLEIGCASGGNLIPLAAQYPNAKFFGVDLSTAHVEHAKARIERLGLKNVEIVQGDVATWIPPGGAFQFMICHGVYSWAPAHVRAAILRRLSQRLSEDGVAYVSYNVLPGWRHKQVLRDTLMWRLENVDDVGAQVRYARAFLELMRGWKGPDSAYHRDLADSVAMASNISDDYLAHEFLEDFNEPQTFTQFMSECGKAGLAFLGECDMAMQMSENFAPETRDLLRTLSQNQLLPMEQTIDVLTGRTFRRTLLVRSAREAQIRRTIEPERLVGLHFLGPISHMVPPAEGFGHSFVSPEGRVISTNHLDVLRALEKLRANGAAGISYADFLDAAGSQGSPARDVAADALFKATIAGVLEARAGATGAASSVGEKPRAPEWIRSDAVAREPGIASLRHRPLALDPAMQVVLPLLDGKRGFDALAEALERAVNAGDLRFRRAEGDVTDEDGIRACARDHAAAALQRLCEGAALAA